MENTYKKISQENKSEELIFLMRLSLDNMVSNREESWKKFISLLKDYKKNKIGWYSQTMQINLIGLCQSINVASLKSLNEGIEFIDRKERNAFLLGDEFINNTPLLKVHWDKKYQVGSLKEIYTIAKEEKITPYKILSIFRCLDRLILFYRETLRKEQYTQVGIIIDSITHKKEGAMTSSP